VGPTGGYLLGYLLAAALTGWLAIGGGTMRRILAMLAGMGVIYAIGAAWLCRFVPAADVWAVGIFPFLMGDLLKIGLAAGLATLWTRGRA
ncbi:biotin transporter BioY, partial [Paracoccus yeei]